VDLPGDFLMWDPLKSYADQTAKCTTNFRVTFGDLSGPGTSEPQDSPTAEGTFYEGEDTHIEKD